MRFAPPLVILTESTMELPNPGGRLIFCVVDAEADVAGGII
jgi:hypothetical protein